VNGGLFVAENLQLLQAIVVQTLKDIKSITYCLSKAHVCKHVITSEDVVLNLEGSSFHGITWVDVQAFESLVKNEFIIMNKLAKLSINYHYVSRMCDDFAVDKSIVDRMENWLKIKDNFLLLQSYINSV